MTEYRMNISAPNIVNVCIDQITETEKQGRMYGCYSREPFRFQNELQLMRKMEELMDWLDYPQSSMKTRSYQKAEREKQADQPEKVWGCEEMLQERGVRGTMVIHVQYRQNATWQGKILCVETGETQEFFSMLELLKIIDNEF